MRHLFFEWFSQERKPIGFKFSSLQEKRNNFLKAIKTTNKTISRVDIQELILKNYLRK